MANNFYASYGGGGVSGSNVVTVQKFTKTYADFSDPSMSKEIPLYTLPAGYVLEYALITVTVAFSGAGITVDTISGNLPGPTAFGTIDASMITGASTASATLTNCPIDFSNTQAITAVLTTSVGNLDGLTAGSANFYLVLNKLT